MKRLMLILLFFVPFLWLAGCSNEPVILITDCLKNEKKIDLSENIYEDVEFLRISDEFKFNASNSVLNIYKNLKPYASTTFVGMLEISNTGHANVFEKDDEFIFLTLSDSYIYINYLFKNRYKYFSVPRESMWNNVYLYVDSKVYIVTTDLKSSNIYLFNESNSEYNFLKNIDYVVKDCVRFLKFDETNFLIQDYSIRYFNSLLVYERSSNIKNYYEPNFYVQKQIAYDNYKQFLCVNNKVQYFGLGVSIESDHIFENGKKGIIYKRTLGFDSYDNFDDYKKVVDLYDNVGYHESTFLVNNNCYYIFYVNKNEMKCPINVSQLVILIAKIDGSFEYGVLENVDFVNFYQYSNYLVLETKEKKIYYEME